MSEPRKKWFDKKYNELTGSDLFALLLFLGAGFMSVIAFALMCDYGSVAITLAILFHSFVS